VGAASGDGTTTVWFTLRPSPPRCGPFAIMGGVSLAPTRPAPPVLPATPPRTLDLRRLLGVTANHFLNDFHMSWLAPLLPLVVARFDLSLALAGLLGTILNTAAALAQPLFGFLTDRLRTGVLAAVGPVLTVAAMALLGLLPAYQVLVLALFAAGLGTAAFHPQGAALAGHLSGDRRAAGLSIFVAGGELAYALGPLYISAIVQWQGLDATGVAALPGVVAAAALAVAVARWPTAPPARRGTLGSALALERRTLVLLWAYVVVRSIVTLTFLTFLPLLLRQQGVSLVMGGTAVFLFGGIGAIGGITGGMLADRWGRRAVLALSFLLALPLLALYLQAPVGWRLALLPVAGVIIYLSAPVTIVMAQEVLPQHAGLASSIVMGLAWGVAALTLTLFGAVADAVGLQRTLTATLALLALGALTVPGLPRGRRRQRRDGDSEGQP